MGSHIFGLWIRAMIYMYPFNVINWVTMVLVCGAMSVCVGAVFSGVRWRYWDGQWQDNVEFHQENITDRLGWHHVMMSVATWPLLLYTLTDRGNFKPMLTRDLDDRLYTKFAYSVTKSLYSLPASAGVFLALTVPAYLLTGIHYPHIADLNSFYTYLGYMMLFLLSSQLLAVLLSNLLASRHIAAVVTGLVVTCQALVSHYLIHRDDLPPWVQWIRYVSPQFWMSQPVLRGEFSGVKTFLCRHNPIINDEQTTIIKQVGCGLANGNQVLEYFKLSQPGLDVPISLAPVLITTIILSAIFLLALLAFCLCRQN